MSVGSRSAGEVVDGVREAIGDEPVGAAARVGLGARGLVYLLLGVVTLSVARGASSDVDQKGVLREVIERPLGGIAVALLALGFACYAGWRLYEAATGVHGIRDRIGPRLQSLGRGLVYAALTVTAVGVLLGSRQSQGSQQRGVVAQLMQDEAGRWLVAAAGAVIVGIGAFLVYEGVRQKFMRWFPAGALPDGSRSTVRRLGTVGTVARGVVFALAGGLVIAAAWNHDPKQAGGVDAVVTALRGQAYGTALLVVMGLGLVAFGIYGLAEARYRRVT